MWLASVTLAKLNSDRLACYVARRKAKGAGNRTVNIKVGVLRRVLKQYRMWQFVSDGSKPLAEPKDIGTVVSSRRRRFRIFFAQW